MNRQPRPWRCLVVLYICLFGLFLSCNQEIITFRGDSDDQEQRSNSERPVDIVDSFDQEPGKESTQEPNGKPEPSEETSSSKEPQKEAGPEPVQEPAPEAGPDDAQETNNPDRGSQNEGNNPDRRRKDNESYDDDVDDDD